MALDYLLSLLDRRILALYRLVSTCSRKTRDDPYSPETMSVVKNFRAIEICEDVYEASSILVVGNTPSVVAFAGKVGKCSVRHGVLWSEVVQENSELIHGNTQV